MVLFITYWIGLSLVVTVMSVETIQFYSNIMIFFLYKLLHSTIYSKFFFLYIINE